MLFRLICVIDDDADCLKLIGHYLKKALPKGVPTALFKDPLLAQEWLATNSPLIMLCDLEMDGRNGFHFLKQLKTREPLTPVILLTGHGNRSALESAVKLGADDFIVKPIMPDDLMHSVNFFVQRASRWRSTVEGLAKLQTAKKIQ